MTCPICDSADPETFDLLAEQIVSHHRDLAEKILKLYEKKRKEV